MKGQTHQIGVLKDIIDNTTPIVQQKEQQLYEEDDLYKFKIQESPEKKGTESQDKGVTFAKEVSLVTDTSAGDEPRLDNHPKTLQTLSNTAKIKPITKKDELLLKTLKSAYLTNKLQSALHPDKFRFDVHDPVVISL